VSAKESSDAEHRAQGRSSRYDKGSSCGWNGLTLAVSVAFLWLLVLTVVAISLGSKIGEKGSPAATHFTSF